VYPTDHHCPMCGHARRDDSELCWTDGCECQCTTALDCAPCETIHRLGEGFCLDHMQAVVSSPGPMMDVVAALAAHHGVALRAA